MIGRRPPLTLRQAQKLYPHGRMCAECRQVLPLDQFTPRVKGDYRLLQSRCKACDSARALRYYYHQRRTSKRPVQEYIQQQLAGMLQ